MQCQHGINEGWEAQPQQSNALDFPKVTGQQEAPGWCQVESVSSGFLIKARTSDVGKFIWVQK